MGAATITLDSSHVAMISHPFAVAALIEKAARDQREVTAGEDGEADSAMR